MKAGTKGEMKLSISCIFYILLLNVVSYANIYKSNALLLGVSLYDLGHSAGSTIKKNFNIIQRAPRPMNKIEGLVKETNSKLIIIKQPSGIYAYNTEGKVIHKFSKKVQNKHHKSTSKKPLPGGNVPEHIFAHERHSHSYLFGEGDPQHHPPYTVARQAIKEFAGIHQNNNIYPFWYENYLHITGSVDEPFYQGDPRDASFSSNSVQDWLPNVAQWLSGGLGITSTLLDAHYDRKAIEHHRQELYHNMHGMPQYAYPNQADTMHPPVSKQPHAPLTHYPRYSTHH